MKQPAEKHFRITYIKEVNMVSPVRLPYKQDYTWDEKHEVLSRYYYLQDHPNITDLKLQVVEIYVVNPEEL